MTTTQYDCKLVAFHTGDGWALTVQNTEGQTIAYLAWPEGWPELTGSELQEKGFEIQ